MTQFYIVSSSNSNLAIQAGANGGDPLTLQTLDTTNLLQIWEARIQNSDGYIGIAMVNTNDQGPAMSVTYNGQFEQLVMQSFSVGSTDQDSWLITQPQAGGSCRIAYPQNASFTWNDYGDNLQPGDQIRLWNDQQANSLWQIVFITPS